MNHSQKVVEAQMDSKMITSAVILDLLVSNGRR